MNEMELLISIMQEFKEEKFLIEPIKQKHPDIFETLQNTEIIYDAGKSKSITCYKCLEPHPAALKRLPIGGYGWRCPETGFHAVGDINLDMGKIDKAKLIEHIRKSVGIKQSKAKFETPIDGLYDLGKLGNKAIEGNFLLYLQDEHPIINNQLHSFLKGQIRPNLGIVFCLYQELEAREYTLPINYYLVPFEHAFAVVNQGFNLNMNNIEQFLHQKANYKRSQKIGRPNSIDITKNALEDLKSDSEFMDSSIRQKAKKIHIHLKYPDTPSENTIRRQINYLSKNEDYRWIKTMDQN